jgi:hypothetical protein
MMAADTAALLEEFGARSLEQSETARQRRPGLGTRTVRAFRSFVNDIAVFRAGLAESPHDLTVGKLLSPIERRFASAVGGR